MTAGLAISGITKNIVFSTRRTDRAINSDNIAVSVGNADIASGQVKNALESAEVLAKETKNGVFTGFKGASDAIKNMSKGNIVMEGIGKVVGFTADHINPVITAVGGIKVLTSDDKESALIQEGAALGSMFTFEAIAKNVLELEKKVKDPISGEKKTVKRVAFYKSNPMLKVQAEKMEKAVNEFCATRKIFNKIPLNHAPGIAKGLLFVGASITGYGVGKAIGDNINNLRNSKEVAETANLTNNTAISRAA